MKKLFFSLVILSVLVANSNAANKKSEVTCSGNQTRMIMGRIEPLIDGPWFGLSVDAYSTGGGQSGYAEAEAYFVLKDNTKVSYVKALSTNGAAVYKVSYYVNPQENAKQASMVYLRASTTASYGQSSWANAVAAW